MTTRPPQGCAAELIGAAASSLALTWIASVLAWRQESFDLLMNALVGLVAISILSITLLPLLRLGRRWTVGDAPASGAVTGLFAIIALALPFAPLIEGNDGWFVTWLGMFGLIGLRILGDRLLAGSPPVPLWRALAFGAAALATTGLGVLALTLAVLVILGGWRGDASEPQLVIAGMALGAAYVTLGWPTTRALCRPAPTEPSLDDEQPDP